MLETALTKASPTAPHCVSLGRARPLRAVLTHAFVPFCRFDVYTGHQVNWPAPSCSIVSSHLPNADDSLYDVPESSIPVQNPDGRILPSHVPPLSAVQNVRNALQNFRKRLPAPFLDDAVSLSPTQPDPPELYDKFGDPWWMMLHFNLYTAEMLVWREMANHHSGHSGAYETAVGCARAVVGLTKRMRPESWTHLGTAFFSHWL